MRRTVKWFAAAWLAVVMLATAAGFGQAVRAAEAAISVGQAIANNAGTATVEGYIVAHTTGTNAYDFEAPFANDFNIALADAPGETDKAKLLPVQLTTGFRAQFGLAANPANIGKKLRITGELSAYFAVPGLRNPTAAEFVGGGEPDPGPTAASIAEARNMQGRKVVVQGVVTSDNAAIGGGNLSTYMQDATAGINIFSQAPEQFPDLKAGDEVRVTGTIASFRGLTEIMPDANGVVVVGSGRALPAPAETSIAALSDAAGGEALEGRLVRLNGYVQHVPSSPAGGGYNVTLVDEGFRAVTLRVMEGTNAIGAVEQGKWFGLTGIASQYDSYQVLLRGAADLALLDPQPAPPTAAGSYEAVVASITDGDTIRLASPVLGTTSVRFVNVDAAETYHAVVTEADANQKRHGEAAKAFLVTLLKAGDAVTLQVGREPTDEYGRLLAQVVRKSDGLNVNLEMVKQGQAATYYIWPIDDSFETFGEAVKQAQAAKRGIWSEADPLLELPFVFRAREQQKGLLRYVGHYGSKTYVEPDRYAEVPVESRVFFASPQEAEAAGYRPAGEEPEGAVKVQLLGVNDWHGKIDLTSTAADRPGLTFGRADYLAAYLKERESANPNTLIVHSGDMIGGSGPVSALLQDEPTVELMEAIGFDVGTPGNHEFDEGTAELLRMIRGGEHPNGTPGYDGMNFPTAAANIVYKSTGELLLEPYAVLETGGVKLGFIGVVTTETPQIVMPSGIADIAFTDEAAAVNKYVPELRAQGVEAIVVLAHVPGSQAGDSASGDIAALANEAHDAVDVIFAAHNHAKLNAVVDGKLVVQAWEYGNAFADIDLEIDPATGDVTAKTAEIVDVIQQDKQPDANAAAILAKYEALVAPKINAVVGESASDLAKGYPTKAVFGDMALGNLIADGMAAAMEADVALMNGGGVRDNVNAGPITWGELFNVQPFGNTLVKVDVTGAELVEILDAMINPQYGPDSFIGGMRYTWNASANKVEKLMLADGTPVDPASSYELVVNNFMYNQTNDRYRLIKQYGENVVNGPEDIEATVAFVKSFGATPIAYAAEGRISTDVTAPVTQAAAEDAVVNFAAEDDGAGVAYTEYRVNGGAWTKGTTANLTGSGVYTVEYRSVDRVFNAEAVKTIAVVADDEGPIVKIDGKTSLYQYERLQVRIGASDAGTGVDRIEVTLDGKPAGTVLDAAPFGLGLGEHRLTIRAVDRAGNETAKDATITVKTDLAHFDEVLAEGYKKEWLDKPAYKSLLQMTEKLQKEAGREKRKRDESFEQIARYIHKETGKKIKPAFAAILLEHVKELEKK